MKFIALVLPVSLNQTLPTGVKAEEWNVYRMDWLPGSTSWYINGKLAGEIKVQVPKDPTTLILNMWGDGGSWSGDMASQIMGGIGYWVYSSAGECDGGKCA